MKKSEKLQDQYTRLCQRMAAATEEESDAKKRADRLEIIGDDDAPRERARYQRMAALTLKLAEDEEKLGAELEKAIHAEKIEDTRAALKAIEGPAAEALQVVNSLTASLAAGFSRLQALAAALPPEALARGMGQCNAIGFTEAVLLGTDDKIHETQPAKIIREIGELRLAFEHAADRTRKELATLEAQG